MTAAASGWRASSIGALMWVLAGCAGSDAAPGSAGGGGNGGRPDAGGAGGEGGDSGGGGSGAAEPGPPCLPGGFCLEHPQLTDADLRGVHGSSAADVWAVGERGTVLRSSDGGATFQRFASNVETALNAVFAVAPDDVWVVGDGGTVRHWDGADWQAVDAGTDADLRDVAVATDGTVWLAGGEDAGVIAAGTGGAFAPIDGAGCGWFSSLVVRDGGQVVVGGRAASTACVARVQNGSAVSEYVDPHPHDPAYRVRALADIGGQVYGVVEGYNTTFVVADDGGWHLEREELAHAFTDVAARAGGGAWIAGGSIEATSGEGCGSSPGETSAIWSTPDGAAVVAVGPGGLGIQVDAGSGCALAKTYEALVHDSWSLTRELAVDAQGTPWFLVGQDVWEYTGSGWVQAFRYADSYQGSYVDHSTGFAACGDGSLRVVAQYYLGDDVYGAVYQPIAYRWERGQGAAAYDDVALVIEEAGSQDRFLLEDVKCDATGAEWFGYRGENSGYLYWSPRSQVSGKIPTSRPVCATGATYDRSLEPSAVFSTESTLAILGGSQTKYYGPTFMLFEGEDCRVLSTSDWPTLPGYVTAAEDGTVETGDSELVSNSLDDVWLVSKTALGASMPQGKLEMAHLEGGSWKVVQVPLPAAVLADAEATVASFGTYWLRPRLAAAGGAVLLQIGGAATTWLLAVEGDDVQVVRGESDPFGSLAGEAYFFASDDTLRTVEMPGAVYARAP